MKDIVRGLGAVVTIKIMAWTFNLIGCGFAAIILHEIYQGTSLDHEDHAKVIGS